MDSGGSMRRPSVEQELTPLRRILFACVRLVSAGKTVPFAQKRDRGVLSATDAPVPPSSADGPSTLHVVPTDVRAIIRLRRLFFFFRERFFNANSNTKQL